LKEWDWYLGKVGWADAKELDSKMFNNNLRIAHVVYSNSADISTILQRRKIFKLAIMVLVLSRSVGTNIKT
jgi:hypothetical protein